MISKIIVHIKDLQLRLFFKRLKATKYRGFLINYFQIVPSTVYTAPGSQLTEVWSIIMNGAEMLPILMAKLIIPIPVLL